MSTTLAPCAWDPAKKLKKMGRPQKGEVPKRFDAKLQEEQTTCVAYLPPDFPPEYKEAFAKHDLTVHRLEVYTNHRIGTYACVYLDSKHVGMLTAVSVFPVIGRMRMHETKILGVFDDTVIARNIEDDLVELKLGRVDSWGVVVEKHHRLFD